MTRADVPVASAALLADQWGDRRGWFDFVVDAPRCHAFVAEDDGDIVGTGVASIHGSVAWIGTIWVDSTRRREGLGTALTNATIDAAETAGSRTLVLVATEAGRPLYEHLGFEVQSWYVTLEADGLAPSETDQTADGSRHGAGPRLFTPRDLPAMAGLDRAATGEDRAHLLAAFAEPGSARVLDGEDGGIAGFVVRGSWGGGATIAPSALDALQILRGRRVAAGPARKVRAGVLADNVEGLALLTANGWKEAWRAPRLIRGEPLQWRPTHIWGQFNHALG